VIRACGISDTGRVRKSNEDKFVSDPDFRFFAVADGMGGHDAGEVASAMVVEALSRTATDESGHASRAAALAALEDVNDRLVEMGSKGFDSRTIGSTVVGLVASGNTFTCFWAGDSRAYRVRSGAIERLTRDHSLVQDLIDGGMITAAEAESLPPPPEKGAGEFEIRRGAGKVARKLGFGWKKRR